MGEDDFVARQIRDLAKVVLEEPSPEELLSFITLNTFSKIECRGAILSIIQNEGFLDLIGTYGYPDEITRNFLHMPLWTPMPITDAARMGETVVIPTTNEVVSRYPHLANTATDENQCVVSIAIKFRGVVIGALGITSVKPPSEKFLTHPGTETFIALCSIYLKNYSNKKQNGNNKSSNPDTKSLTSRQKKIIQLFENDSTTDEIANQLRDSASTIKQDIIQIYKVFGVNNRHEVLELAKRAGINQLSPPPLPA